MQTSPSCRPIILVHNINVCELGNLGELKKAQRSGTSRILIASRAIRKIRKINSKQQIKG